MCQKKELVIFADLECMRPACDVCLGSTRGQRPHVWTNEHSVRPRISSCRSKRQCCNAQFFSTVSPQKLFTMSDSPNSQLLAWKLQGLATHTLCRCSCRRNQLRNFLNFYISTSLPAGFADSEPLQSRRSMATKTPCDFSSNVMKEYRNIEFKDNLGVQKFPPIVWAV